MALQMSWQPSLHRRKSGPPLGLKNLGNTCYLNSVLQCLTYTPPLANFCLLNQHSNLCEKQDTNRKRDCPFCIIEKRIARSLNLEAPNDAPQKISNCIRLFAEHFQWGRQEDAHEFLRYVIDACHNTCLRLHKAGASGASPNGTKGSGAMNRGRTIVKDIFGGALLSQVKCLSCGGESNKTDEMMDISLDLFHSSSLNDALRRFFQPEILDGDNKYSCGSCKKLSAARKQMFVLQAPNVLVIQLKRFEGVNGGKINKDIAFEEVLLLSSFMSKASQDPHPEYNLFGSIVHSGYSPESGHYYAYIKDPAGCWYCCNDAYVSLSTTQKVLSEKVYILFYLRGNQKAKLVKNISPYNGTKCSDSNGHGAVQSAKASIVSKPPAPRTNGIIHSERDVSTVPKTAKVPTSPRIKFGIFNNLEKKNVGASAMQKNVGATQKNGHSKVRIYLAIDKNGNSGQLLASEENCTLSNKPGSTGQADILRTSNGNCAEVNASSGNVDKTKLAACKNGSTTLKNAVTNETKNALPVGAGSDNCFLSQNVSGECRSNELGNKRKFLDDASASSIQLFDSFVSNVSKEHGTFSILDRHHSPGGLERFKKVLFEEASSALRSSGWVEEVHNFMHAQKRICSQAAANPSDHSRLRNVLVADAKKFFIPRLPEDLKGHLIGRLKSFSKGKHI